MHKRPVASASKPSSNKNSDVLIDTLLPSNTCYASAVFQLTLLTLKVVVNKTMLLKVIFFQQKLVFHKFEGKNKYFQKQSINNHCASIRVKSFNVHNVKKVSYLFQHLF